MDNIKKLDQQIADAIENYILDCKKETYKNWRMQRKENMLYPQYEYEFTTISKYEFKSLQKRAAELLAEARERASPDVVSHWISIVNGVVPFGYTLNRSEEF